MSLSVSHDQNRHSKSVFTLSERGPSDAQACIPQRRQPLPTFRRGDPVLLDAGSTNRCQQSLSVSRDTRTFWGAAVCAWTVRHQGPRNDADGQQARQGNAARHGDVYAGFGRHAARPCSSPQYTQNLSVGGMLCLHLGQRMASSGVSSRIS